MHCGHSVAKECRYCGVCGVYVGVGDSPDVLHKHSPLEYLNVCLLSAFFGGTMAGAVGLLVPGFAYLSGVVGFSLGRRRLEQVDAYGRVQYLEGFLIGAMAGLWGGLFHVLFGLLIAPEDIVKYQAPYGELGAPFALIVPLLASTFVSLYVTLLYVTVLRKYASFSS